MGSSVGFLFIPTKLLIIWWSENHIEGGKLMVWIHSVYACFPKFLYIEYLKKNQTAKKLGITMLIILLYYGLVLFFSIFIFYFLMIKLFHYVLLYVFHGPKKNTGSSLRDSSTQLFHLICWGADSLRLRWHLLFYSACCGRAETRSWWTVASWPLTFIMQSWLAPSMLRCHLAVFLLIFIVDLWM